MTGQGARLARFGLPIATAAVAAAIFAADTITPSDIAFANFYVAVVILSARFCRPSGVRWVAAGCGALTLLSYYISLPSGPAYESVGNLLIGVAVIAMTAFLVVRDQSRQLALRTVSEELARRATDLEAANRQLASLAESDRIRADASARSEAYLAEAQELTQTGSWAWNPRFGELLHCSEEVFRLYGLDPKAGTPTYDALLERIHPEDREWVREAGASPEARRPFEPPSRPFHTFTTGPPPARFAPIPLAAPTVATGSGHHFALSCNRFNQALVRSWPSGERVRRISEK